MAEWGEAENKRNRPNESSWSELASGKIKEKWDAAIDMGFQLTQRQRADKRVCERCDQTLRWRWGGFEQTASQQEANEESVWLVIFCNWYK